MRNLFNLVCTNCF